MVRRLRDGREIVDDFFDPSSSIASCSSSSGGTAGFWNRTMSAVSESEFYDADQDFSDSVSQSFPSFSKDFETEVQHLRLNLCVEIEKRKNAEKAIIDMQNWWNGRISVLHGVIVAC